jgi:hypothetical protein
MAERAGHAVTAEVRGGAVARQQLLETEVHACFAGLLRPGGCVAPDADRLDGLDVVGELQLLTQHREVEGVASGERHHRGPPLSAGRQVFTRGRVAHEHAVIGEVALVAGARSAEPLGVGRRDRLDGVEGGRQLDLRASTAVRSTSGPGRGAVATRRNHHPEQAHERRGDASCWHGRCSLQEAFLEPFEVRRASRSRPTPSAGLEVAQSMRERPQAMRPTGVQQSREANLLGAGVGLRARVS